jgi:probable HAF family extracellular repeat protein
VNTAGELVGCYDTRDLNFHGFLYSNGTFTTIDYPGEQTTCWLGINDVGQLVGYAWMPDFFLGLSYDRNTRTFTAF